MAKHQVYIVTDPVRELFKRRKTQKITDLDLAAKAGYSTKHIYNIANGLTDPTFNCVAVIAESLGYAFVLMDKDMADAINKKRIK